MNTASNVIPFRFDATDVRVVERDGELWFIAADVCAVLTIGNPSDAVSRLDDDERTTLGTIEGHAGLRGVTQSQNAVNEAGLYSLILTSRKPEAKRFKRWITHEVLPALRRAGSYAMPGVAPAANEPESYADLDTERRAATSAKANELVQALFRPAREQFGAIFAKLGVPGERIDCIDASALYRSGLVDLSPSVLAGAPPQVQQRPSATVTPLTRKTDRTAAERQRRHRARLRAAADASRGEASPPPADPQ